MNNGNVDVERIKTLAKSKGITIKHLCDAFGLGRGYFNDVKAGKTTMDEGRVAKTAEMLGTTVEYLRDETDDPNKNNSADKLLPDILYRVSELSDDKQKEIFAFIEFKLHQQDEENK